MVDFAPLWHRHHRTVFCDSTKASRSTRSNKSLFPSFKNGIRLSHTSVRRNHTWAERYVAASLIVSRRTLTVGATGFDCFGFEHFMEHPRFSGYACFATHRRGVGGMLAANQYQP